MIKVIHPGFYSTIQDLGRFGYQQFGVPYSGVMDRYAATLSNQLLGNTKASAVIEMTMTGATLEFLCATNICISGADMRPQLNAIEIPLNKSMAVHAGDILSFGTLKSGFRCYLAVSGGINTKMIMNSRSMYKGVTDRFRLAKPDELLIPNASIFDAHASVRTHSDYMTSEYIEVYKGPEFNKLSVSEIKKLKSTSFTISKDNSRMAYQLEQPLKNSLEPIITSPVMPGTVQLTPSGSLIVLMRDCQTTGGYPRILQLKETSINSLAQKFTGQNIAFKLVNY